MLSRVLRAEGYEVERASTGAEAMSMLSRLRPDLVILDVVLQGENGFEILASIRRTSDVPVIMVTGKDAESDRVLGLRLGADDYVAKPFSAAELCARVASVLRRLDKRDSRSADSLEFGDLSIDLLAREVKVSGRLVTMTAKEFDPLVFIARSPRQVFLR